jgi:prepilin-type N-terminal cleavage/methylation domain-containing protein
MRATRSRHPSLGSAAAGFTLVELLMVAVLGALLMTGAASMMLSHMRSSARAEAILRLQDAWSRVQFLLDQEIAEASGSPTTTSCSSLSLAVPDPEGGSDLEISYSLSGTDLMRTGPTVGSDGTLDSGTSSTDLVMSNVTSFCPTHESGEVNYTLSLRDASGVTYQNQSQPSGSRTRSRVIN